MIRTTRHREGCKRLSPIHNAHTTRTPKKKQMMEWNGSGWGM